MRFFYFTILFLGLLSCASATHVDIDAVIEEKVQERLDEFREVIMKRCQDKALEEAGLLADSIIIEQARLKKDTTERPPRPLRPDQPEVMTLEDSLELAPLFDTTAQLELKDSIEN